MKNFDVDKILELARKKPLVYINILKAKVVLDSILTREYQHFLTQQKRLQKKS